MVKFHVNQKINIYCENVNISYVCCYFTFLDIYTMSRQIFTLCLQLELQ